MKKNYILIILISLLVLSPKLYAQVEGCVIAITKEANPADNTPFEFDISGTGGMFSFTLSTPADKSGGFNFFIDVETSVDVTEILPEGWMLDEIECSEVENVVITEIPNGRNFACNPAGTAQCVFINSLPSNVPTLSEWGLIAMAGILGIVGFMVIRRRKVTA